MAIWDITEEWDTELRSGDPLGFPGYADKVAAMDHESVRTGLGDGCVVIAGDFAVMGGSMGVVHGEKVVRAIDQAITRHLPVVIVTRSGGARMQEGMVSLIQMGRTMAAMNRLRHAGLLSVGVLLHPTTGGVFVSYGAATDVRGAQAGATIGFAGPRVAETVTGESVTGQSHTAETAMAAGLVDFVGDLSALDVWVRSTLRCGFGSSEEPSEPLAEARVPRAEAAETKVGEAWDEVLAARAPQRHSGRHMTAHITDAFVALGSTDPTMHVGLAVIGAHRIMLIAQDRHAGTGRTTPDGFRVARRAIALASRLGLPIVTLIDTPGAEPGSASELDHIGEEISATFAAMLDAPVPTISVCIGEGGSGGALALGVTDTLLMQTHAIFSVIGPEGAASILHRDAARAPEVAALLKLTSHDLEQLGIVDAVIEESPDALRGAILDALAAPSIGRRVTRLDTAAARWIVERP